MIVLPAASTEFQNRMRPGKLQHSMPISGKVIKTRCDSIRNKLSLCRTEIAIAPDKVANPLETRLRALESKPNNDDGFGEKIEQKRSHMIHKILELQELNSNTDRLYKETSSAIREYRVIIPRGHWKPLRIEISANLKLCERDFYRLLDLSKSTDQPNYKRITASRNNASTVICHALEHTIKNSKTERLRASHTQHAENIFAEAAKSERSDVFIRRIASQIALRFPNGTEHSKADRVKGSLKLLESLGLTPQDLM